MPLDLPYFTLRDPSLPHQVVLQVHDGRKITVSCNCRLKLHGAVYTYESMGETHDIDESRRLYNDPANHRIPFNKEDEAKW